MTRNVVEIISERIGSATPSGRFAATSPSKVEERSGGAFPSPARGGCLAQRGGWGEPMLARVLFPLLLRESPRPERRKAPALLVEEIAKIGHDPDGDRIAAFGRYVAGAARDKRGLVGE